MRGAPTGRSRSGRWPAPDRGTGRWPGGGRGRARCARAQLQVDLPLQVLVEHHATANVCGGRRAVSGGIGVLVAARATAARSTGRDCGGAGARRARSRWRSAPADRPRAARKRLEFAGARRRPCRHSRRNCTNSSFRKRSLSAATRSYSTRARSRRASISAATAGVPRSRRARRQRAKSSTPSTSR